MTTLDLDTNSSRYQIRSYKPGTLRVNDQIITSSMIITPNELITWAPQSIHDITPESFNAIIPLKPDVLLIGTGASLVLLPIEIYGELLNQGIGVEIMDTSAACRTFNALSAENRRVAAALIV